MPLGNVGLALGGGGVKGLAHIPLLKVLDEFNIAPVKIVGTSMGAIIGALYATGLSGRDIETKIHDHIVLSGEPAKAWIQKRKQLIKWAKVFRLERKSGGLMAADGFFEFLFTELLNIHFSDLATPFSAIATNFHTAEDVEMNSGDVLSAVRASMAVPGVFAPIERDGVLLIDGGAVNNVPCDKIFYGTDFRIASDVINLPSITSPSVIQTISGTMNVILTHATRQRLNAFPPDLLFAPNTTNIEPFDFSKINQALKQGEIEAEKFRQKLQSHLTQHEK